MIRKLCKVVGHRRHERRARPYLETWRSECVRCGMPMVRSAPGLWTEAPTLRDFVSAAYLSSDSAVARYPERAKPSVENRPGVAADPLVAHLHFSHELARAMTADRPSVVGRHRADGRREHYLARSAECRSLAEAATNPSIELIHLDMATRYDILARQAEDERRPLSLVS